MTNPMTAEEARETADSFPGSWGHYEQTRIRATLRAYADMLERQTVDREAMTKVIEDIIYYGPPPESPEPYVDRILALMPASDISPPAMSESGAVSTNNPNVAHMKHAKDGEVERLREALEAFAAMRPDSSEASENLGTMRLTWEADTDLFTAPIEMTKRARQALSTFKGGEAKSGGPRND